MPGRGDSVTDKQISNQRVNKCRAMAVPCDSDGDWDIAAPCGLDKIVMESPNSKPFSQKGKSHMGSGSPNCWPYYKAPASSHADSKPPVSTQNLAPI